MGSKTRLSSYCTNRGNNTVNLVTSRKTIARLARPIHINCEYAVMYIVMNVPEAEFYRPDLKL